MSVRVLYLRCHLHGGRGRFTEIMFTGDLLECFQRWREIMNGDRLSLRPRRITKEDGTVLAKHLNYSTKNDEEEEEKKEEDICTL